MFTFIYLLSQDIIIHCMEMANCIQISTSHFTWLLEMGALEVIFELAGIVRILRLKDEFKPDGGEEKEK